MVLPLITALFGIGSAMAAPKQPETNSSLHPLADLDVIEVESVETKDFIYRGVVVSENSTLSLAIEKIGITKSKLKILVSRTRLLEIPGGEKVRTGEGSGIIKLAWNANGLEFENFVISHGEHRYQKCLISVFDPEVTVTCK